MSAVAGKEAVARTQRLQPTPENTLFVKGASSPEVLKEFLDMLQSKYKIKKATPVPNSGIHQTYAAFVEPESIEVSNEILHQKSMGTLTKEDRFSKVEVSRCVDRKTRQHDTSRALYLTGIPEDIVEDLPGILSDMGVQIESFKIAQKNFHNMARAFVTATTYEGFNTILNNLTPGNKDYYGIVAELYKTPLERLKELENTFTTVYVCCVPPTVSKTQFREVVDSILTRAPVYYNYQTTPCSGFASITCEDNTEAKKLINKLHCSTFTADKEWKAPECEADKFSPEKHVYAAVSLSKVHLPYIRELHSITVSTTFKYIRKDVTRYTIRVDELPDNSITTMESIYKMFCKYGHIVSLSRRELPTKLFVYIGFSTLAAATNAVKDGTGPSALFSAVLMTSNKSRPHHAITNPIQPPMTVGGVHADFMTAGGSRMAFSGSRPQHHMPKPHGRPDMVGVSGNYQPMQPIRPMVQRGMGYPSMPHVGSANATLSGNPAGHMSAMTRPPHYMQQGMPQHMRPPGMNGPMVGLVDERVMQANMHMPGRDYNRE